MYICVLHAAPPLAAASPFSLPRLVFSLRFQSVFLALALRAVLGARLRATQRAGESGRRTRFPARSAAAPRWLQRFSAPHRLAYPFRERAVRPASVSRPSASSGARPAFGPHRRRAPSSSSSPHGCAPSTPRHPSARRFASRPSAHRPLRRALGPMPEGCAPRRAPQRSAARGPAASAEGSTRCSLRAPVSSLCAKKSSYTQSVS